MLPGNRDPFLLFAYANLPADVVSFSLLSRDPAIHHRAFRKLDTVEMLFVEMQ